jgi:hypothetical protein
MDHTTIPMDAFKEILVHLNPNDIVSSCSTSKYIHFIYDDDDFWYNYITLNYVPQAYGYESFQNMKSIEHHNSYKNIFEDIVYPSKLIRSYLSSSKGFEEEKPLAISRNDTMNDIFNRITRVFNLTLETGSYIKINLEMFDNLVLAVSSKFGLTTNIAMRLYNGRVEVIKKVDSNTKLGVLYYNDMNFFNNIHCEQGNLCIRRYF